jgi:hypothetical protein
VEILAEAFVVAEDKGAVAADGASGGRAELIALERRSGPLIEKVGRVERVVAEKFVNRTVKTVGAGLGSDDDLAAGMLAEFGAVVVALDIEFANGVDAEELTARSAGLHVVFGSAGEFDPVEKKNILLRAIAIDGEIVGGGGVGDAGAAGFLRGEIDDTGIEGEEKIVTAAVERKIFYGLLCDEAGDIGGGGADDRRVGIDVSHTLDLRDSEDYVNIGLLIYDEVDTSADVVNESSLGSSDRIFTDGEAQDEISARIVCGYSADGGGFNVFCRDRGARDAGTRRVTNNSGNTAGYLGLRSGNCQRGEDQRTYKKRQSAECKR